jgi:hypothetical protein
MAPGGAASLERMTCATSGWGTAEGGFLAGLAPRLGLRDHLKSPETLAGAAVLD